MAWQNRVSFYKIPFSRTGVTYPLPTIGGIYADLESYKIGEIITEKPFNENQTRITTPAMTDALLACNYIRVGRVNPDAETPAGANDTNVSYFWCLDCYRLGTSNGEDGNTPGVFEIEPDDVMTEFFEGSATEVAGRSIIGRLARCSKLFTDTAGRMRFNTNCERVAKIYTENYNITPGFAFKGEQYIYIISLTTERGTIYNFYLVATADNVTSYISILSNVFGFYYGTSSEYTSYINISISEIFCFGYELFRGAVFYDIPVSLLYRTNSGATRRITAYILVTEDTGMRRDISKTYSKKFYIFNYSNKLPDNSKVFDKLFLFTPSRIIEVENCFDQYFTVNIQINIAGDGVGSIGVGVSLIINNKIYDITNDFKIPFAVNEGALKQAQFQASTTIQYIGNILGSIGGMIGGFASGNYFGALQSLVGGIQGVTNLQNETRAPAQLKTEGLTMTMIQQTGGAIGYMIVQQDVETETIIMRNGYIYTDSPVLTLTANNITEDYYQFASCEVPEVAGGGQNAQATIETMFLRGVRFKAL